MLALYEILAMDDDLSYSAFQYIHYILDSLYDLAPEIMNVSWNFEKDYETVKRIISRLRVSADDLDARLLTTDAPVEK